MAERLSSRRRLETRHDSVIRHWHTRRPARASCTSYQARARGRERSGGDDAGMHDLLLIHADRSLRHSPSANERLPVHRCDGTWIVRICVVHVGDVVHRVVVIDLRDLRPIVVARAAPIDLLDVSRIHAVGRNIYVTRTQRIPADPLHAPKRDGNSKSSAAYESNKSRRIHRRDRHRPWHPAPRSVNHCPSAIVKGREAPWFGVNPSPAPRCNPTPMARVVGNPAGSHVVGHPVVAILGVRVP